MAGRVLVFILSAVACALLFAPSTTAQGPILTVKVAKQKDGSYRGTTKVEVGRDETVSLWYRVKNVSPGDLEYSFDDSNDKIPEDLSIKWFKGQTNVSHDVQTAGHDFTLEAGKSKYFRAKVRAETNNIVHCVAGRGGYNDSFYKSAYAGINDQCDT